MITADVWLLTFERLKRKGEGEAEWVLETEEEKAGIIVCEGTQERTGDRWDLWRERLL